jgi:hypothetical protein
MAIIEKIKSFLSNVNDISIGYAEINFIQPGDLDEGQIGYSVDPDGNSLTASNEGSWQEEWLVIATDELGDPIFLDINSPALTVLSAPHGEGVWKPFMIARTLDNLKNIIADLEKISTNRTNPVDLEKNPITEKERQYVLARIVKHNPEAEIWFWENILDADS